MLYLTGAISLYTLLLIRAPTSAKQFSNGNKFYSTIETEFLSSQEIDNLGLVLNFIRNSSEFSPLTFSVILPEFQSNFVDFLLRYIEKNSIEAYKVRARDLSPMSAWMNQTRLTWIFVVHDLTSLNVFIYWQWELWKASSQYLVIFAGKGIIVPWRNVFKNLWKRYSVYRAIIVPIDDDFQCLMTYMPFEEFDGDFGSVHKLCLKKSSAETIREHSFLQSSLENEHLGHEKILQSNRGLRLFENFQNMNRYPLNVIVFESLLMNVSLDDQNRLKLDKPDANVVFTLEKAMGAKFRINALRKIDFKEDPFAFSLKGIESGKVDMVVTGFFVKIYHNFQKFQFTSAMYEDSLCFLSPDSGLIPKAYMPFLPFQKSLWAALIAYNIMVTLLWYFVKHISESLRQQHSINLQLKLNHPKGKPQISDLPKSGVIITLAHLENHSQTVRPHRSDLANSKAPPEIPRRVRKFFTFVEHLCYPLQSGETPSQRALLFGTLFFNLIVNGVYQSYLVSSLSNPFHYPQLHTLEDVIQSGKIVVTKYANLKNVFLNDGQLDMKMSQQIHVIRTQRPTREFVAYEDKISITRYQTEEFEDISYYDKEGNPLLYVVDEHLMSYRVSYVLRLHSPYADRVDYVLLGLREAGFFSFWFENTIYPIRISKMKRKLDMEKRKVKLTMDHFLLTFLLLFLGLFGSTLMFFGEFYIAKRNTRLR